MNSYRTCHFQDAAKQSKKEEPAVKHMTVGAHHHCRVRTAELRAEISQRGQVPSDPFSLISKISQQGAAHGGTSIYGSPVKFSHLLCILLQIASSQIPACTS